MKPANSGAAETGILRILVPINANQDSRWGVKYALRRHREGVKVDVTLLHVGEPVTRWEVLRFRTQQEIAQFQAERAEAFIADAAGILAAEGVPHRGIFKQGEVAFSILDAAEELSCQEIAMPQPQSGVMRFLSRNTVVEVERRQRGIAVVKVDEEGTPVGS